MAIGTSDGESYDSPMASVLSRIFPEFKPAGAKSDKVAGDFPARGSVLDSTTQAPVSMPLSELQALSSDKKKINPDNSYSVQGEDGNWFRATVAPKPTRNARVSANDNVVSDAPIIGVGSGEPARITVRPQRDKSLQIGSGIEETAGKFPEFIKDLREKILPGYMGPDTSAHEAVLGAISTALTGLRAGPMRSPVPPSVDMPGLPAPRGSLEELGRQTFNREVGRNQETQRFGNRTRELNRGLETTSEQIDNNLAQTRATLDRITEYRAAQDAAPSPFPEVTRMEQVPFPRSGRMTGGEIPVAKERLGSEFKLERRSEIIRHNYLNDNPIETHSFLIKNEKGERVGHGSLTLHDDGKVLYVNGLYSKTDESMSLGPKAIKNFVRQIKELYPNAERITATRVTGARHGKAAVVGKINRSGFSMDLR